MKKLLVFVLLVGLMVSMLPAQAHEGITVEVSDQVSTDGSVVVSHVTAEVDGFIVIHKDNEGSFGPPIGNAHVHAGENDNVRVWIDAAEATPVLYAMLHEDTGEAGVYEFGTVEGADGPVVVDGAPVSPPFNVQLLAANPQFVDGSFVVDAAVTDAAGFVVVHAGAGDSFGEVLGVAPIEAGSNTGITIELEGEATANLWPMLHVDTGEAGVYEFGTVEGADGPIVIDGVVATMPVPTVSTIIAHPQVIVHADNYEMDDMMMMEDMGPMLHVQAVLAEVDGFVVVHQDNGEGRPGPVAGFAPVAAGLTTDLAIELDPAMVTNTLFPMLHVDDNVAGEYEFGTVEGADAPVAVDGNVVVVPVPVAPSFGVEPQALGEGGTIAFAGILTDAQGWMVIHASVDGAPGPVLGVAPVGRGANPNVVVSGIDFASVDGAATDQVFPMLHYDTGAIGQYEFDGSNGLDLPVVVGGNVVVAPLEIQ